MADSSADQSGWLLFESAQAWPTTLLTGYWLEGPFESVQEPACWLEELFELEREAEYLSMYYQV